MNPDRKARLDRKLAALTRMRHVPVLEDGDGDGLVSQLGGVAWLRPDEAWPCCEDCEEPMHLLLQLRAADAPAGAVVVPEGQLLQVFHCGAEHEFSPPWALARLIDEAGAVRAADPPEGASARRIVGFTSAPEIPGHGDRRKAETLRLNEREHAALERDARNPSEDVKLGGWPLYYVWREKCGVCRAPRPVVAQLDGGGVVNLGDFGVAYLQQCPDHADQLTVERPSS